MAAVFNGKAHPGGWCATRAGAASVLNARQIAGAHIFPASGHGPRSLGIKIVGFYVVEIGGHIAIRVFDAVEIPLPGFVAQVVGKVAAGGHIRVIDGGIKDRVLVRTPFIARQQLAAKAVLCAIGGGHQPIFFLGIGMAARAIGVQRHLPLRVILQAVLVATHLHHSGGHAVKDQRIVIAGQAEIVLLRATPTANLEVARDIAALEIPTDAYPTGLVILGRGHAIDLPAVVVEDDSRRRVPWYHGIGKKQSPWVPWKRRIRP